MAVTGALFHLMLSPETLESWLRPQVHIVNVVECPIDLHQSQTPEDLLLEGAKLPNLLVDIIYIHGSGGWLPFVAITFDVSWTTLKQSRQPCSVETQYSIMFPFAEPKSNYLTNGLHLSTVSLLLLCQ